MANSTITPPFQWKFHWAELYIIWPLFWSYFMYEVYINYSLNHCRFIFINKFFQILRITGRRKNSKVRRKLARTSKGKKYLEF